MGHDDAAAEALWSPPRLPASAGALIFDGADRLLIVKPTYKSGWTIPGGQMEADGETPWEACRREVREETGLSVEAGRLAAVDFLRPRAGKPGGLRFLFDCGSLPDAVLECVVLDPAELSEHRFAAVDDALGLLSGPLRRRVSAALGGTGVVYLEGGLAVAEVS